MSDEHADDQQQGPVAAEHRPPGPEHERVTGDAATAPAAQPRESASDTTA